MIHGIRRAAALLEPRERWRWAALVPLAVVVAALEAAGAGAVVLLVRLIADPAQANRLPAPVAAWLPRAGGVSATVAFAAAVGVFYVARCAILLAIDLVEQQVIQRTVARLSARLLARYLHAPYSFHFGRRSAALIQNVSEGAEKAVEAVLAPVIRLLAETLVVAVLLGLLAAFAPREMLAVVAILLLLVAAPVGLTRRTHARWGAVERALGEQLLAHLHQCLDAIKDIAVAGRRGYFLSRFEADRRRLMRVKAARDSGETAVRIGVETALIAAMLVAVILMTLAGRSGPDAVSTISLFAYAGFRIVPSANRIILNVNVIRYGLAYAGPLSADWFALDEPRPEAEEVVAWPPLAGAITLEDVSYGYGDGRVHALDGVSLAIPRGASIGIVGLTGAGKSTLVDVILGLLPPSRGRVLVDGRDIRENVAGWQAQLGYVAQHVVLLDDTLRRNIAFALDDDRIDDRRVGQAVQAAGLSALVASLPAGIHARVGERGSRLSGGERQRIAIARALYRDPAVLIFDEATSALDQQTEREIGDAIAAARGERTTLVIAHRMTTVRRCDRLVVLDGGRVVAEGTFDELSASSGAFRALAAGAAEHR